ncbi:hypothetical protein K2173_027389 [Erythroxylum novogranatense]|uniref:Tetraspanin-8-like n=1 Tax=Erythroxylum novogranatense TaxID=1862640 RepID=A0AAV8TYY1_9ROSI|nr:hypothetical protein K2173_027389 [Erythroxylum novogranatense]
MGIVVTVIGVLGLAGSCCKNNVLLGLYLFLLFLTIVALATICTFMVVLIAKNASSKGSQNAEGGGLNSRMQKFVVGKWVIFKSCLVDSHVCQALANNTNPKSFLQQNFVPIEVGCCMPPADCGLKHMHGPNRNMTKSGVKSKDPDCALWSNKSDKLCFDCISCMGGVLFNIQKQTRNVAILYACLVVLVIFVFSTGCCAMRSISRRKQLGLI